jgi:hypothetical protein
MNIPLDRLYQYIECQAQRIWQDHVLIYRFYPHGSKDFHDLSFLTSNYTLDDLVLCPYVYCNDQEPLNWKHYQYTSNQSSAIAQFMQQLGLPKQNLRDYPINIWDWAVLLHSERGGHDLAQYQADGFLTVYYWSHAVIARDWFRFAEKIVQQKQPTQTIFLIYNRAWSGTREYRLKFADLLIEQDLVDQCRTWANSCDVNLGMHYSQYTFGNDQWRPQHQLENYFEPSSASSENSADFDLIDYENTQVEVVLETLFDDDRIHLTEKTLRPIALGQPFVLVSTAGSLKYLKHYGFETFDSVWSESYDQISDPGQRLLAIVSVMKTIADWTPAQREKYLQQAQAIAQRNRERFFSLEFEQQVLHELDDNLTKAFQQLRQCNTSTRWIQWCHAMRTLPAQQFQQLEQSLIEHGDCNHFVSRFTEQHWEKFLSQTKKYQIR